MPQIFQISHLITQILHDCFDWTRLFWQVLLCIDRTYPLSLDYLIESCIPAGVLDHTELRENQDKKCTNVWNVQFAKERQVYCNFSVLAACNSLSCIKGSIGTKAKQFGGTIKYGHHSPYIQVIPLVQEYNKWFTFTLGKQLLSFWRMKGSTVLGSTAHGIGKKFG